jgi:hypothetical protein
MFKSSRISEVLAETTDSISKQLNLKEDGANGGFMISLTSSDGNLLASSVRSDSPVYQVCQRVSAVAASMALEYMAIEKLTGSGFRTLTFSTEVRLTKCSRLCKLADNTALFLVVSLPSHGLDELALLGLTRAVVDRIEEDLLPSISPVLENMVSASKLE